MKTAWLIRVLIVITVFSMVSKEENSTKTFKKSLCKNCLETGTGKSKIKLTS